MTDRIRMPLRALSVRCLPVGAALSLFAAGCTGFVVVDETPREAPSWTGGDAVLAIRKIHFGDVDLAGIPSSTAWRSYGLNIDGKVSDETSTDLCKPAAGAKEKWIYPDGIDGIDNSFGHSLLPIFPFLYPDFTQHANATIEQGRGTMIVRIQAPSPGSGPDEPLLSQVYFGAFPPDKTPKWNGQDVWPLDALSLDGGDVDSPKTVLSSSYLAEGPSGGRRWWSGDPLTIELRIPVDAFDLNLRVHQAVLAMDLSPDNAHATGILGGVLDTEEFVEEFLRLVVLFDPMSFCGLDPGLESVVQQLRQASDILVDGTQDPTKHCDGISIGLRFEAEAAALGPPVDLPPPPELCPDP